MALGVCTLTLLLSMLGYRAFQDSRRSERLLASQRADNAAHLLAVALARDMRGAQESVLLSSQWDASTLGTPYQMYRLLQSALARYPYPEAFFSWRGALTGDGVTFVSRMGRPPAWAPDAGAEPFPLHIFTNASVATVVARAFSASDPQRTIWVVPAEIDGAPYQLVAHPLYRDAYREELVGGLGFLVNTAWARAVYFPELVQQVARTAALNGLASRLIDDGGTELVRTAVPACGPTSRRSLVAMFADPGVADDTTAAPLWTVHVTPDASAARAASAVLRYGGPLLLSGGLIAGLLTLGLAVISHSSRAAAQLADMRSEFAATMTHELKTPVASVRALGEAIAAGRVSDPQAVREYGQLVVNESERLGRLVANSLAFAQASEVSQSYVHEAIEVASLLRDAVRRFASQLSVRAIDVRLDLDEDGPQVVGDRTALSLVLDNLIDNAIKYGGESPSLEIAAREAGDVVRISVRDRGIGIPPDELPHVRRKFFRGRTAGSGGAGLGLTIVERILAAHRGHLSIKSRSGGGTDVCVVLPARKVRA